LQWLLELRTLRGHIKQLEAEGRRLKRDYEKALKQPSEIRARKKKLVHGVRW